MFHFRIRLTCLYLVALCIALSACSPTSGPTVATPAGSATAPLAPLPTITALPPTITPLPTVTPLPPTLVPLATPTAVAPSPTPTSSPAPPTLTPTPRVFQFQEFQQQAAPIVQAFMKSNNVAACSLAVAYPDTNAVLLTPILNYGTLSKTSQTAVDASTLYEIGSLSKLFTADLLAFYVQNGKMKLDDPLQMYLPSNFQVPIYNGQPITLRALATHTSGLPRKPDTLPEFRVVNGVMVWGYASTADMQKALTEVKLTSAPGSQWLYSNFAFSLLAMAEEKVGNAPFETLVENNIALPLSLRDTRITLTAVEKARLAQGVGINGEAIAPFATSGELLGAGALRSTIQDLALYLAENLVPATTKIQPVLELTQQRQARGANANSAAGLGWNIAAPGTPRESLSKDGATDGYDAYIAFSRISHSGFVVACDGHNLAKSLVPPLAKLVGEFDVPIDDNEP